MSSPAGVFRTYFAIVLEKDGLPIEVKACVVGIGVQDVQYFVHHLDLEAVTPERLLVEATTSSGFYVRSLAHDIGAALGCGGHLQHLLRTAIGPYAADLALSQEALQTAEWAEEIIEGNAWIPLDKVVLPFT